MCGKYDDVREVPPSEEMGGDGWPCCKNCFMSDSCTSDPPMTHDEKLKLFNESMVLN